MSQPPTEREIEPQQTAPPQPSDASQHKRRDFIIGFFGWFVINAWLVTITVIVSFYFYTRYYGAHDAESEANSRMMMLINAANFLVNIVGLVLLGFRRRWIAFGALAAFGATLFVTTLVGGLAAAAGCFTYFAGFSEFK